MRIKFICDTNADIPFVNTAVFRTARGDITIDRVSTYYTYYSEDQCMDMIWCGCYVWNGNKEDFDMAEHISDEITAVVYLEIEDDADDVLSAEEYNKNQYYCRPLVCLVDGREVPVLHKEAV